MFSSIPIDENILKDELEITSINDRDFILLQINKDIKYIFQKSIHFNYNLSINEIRLSKKLKKINKEEKEKVSESSKCFVF